MQREQTLWETFKTNEKYFKLMTNWYKNSGYAIEDKIRELILANVTGNVLDAGCGKGSVTNWFADR